MKVAESSNHRAIISRLDSGVYCLDGVEGLVSSVPPSHRGFVRLAPPGHRVLED